MAITLVSGFPITAASANSNDVTTGTINSTGATLLVLLVSDYNGGGAVVAGDISETGATANTWAPLTNQLSGGGLGLNFKIFYVNNPNTNASHTFKVTKTGGYPVIHVYAFAGTDTTTAFDSQEAGSGTAGATTIKPGSVTPSGNGFLLITGFADNTTLTATIDSSFNTPTRTNSGGGTNVGIATSYYIQPTAGAVDLTWTSSASTEMASRVAVFKAGAGGGGGATTTTVRKALLGVGI